MYEEEFSFEIDEREGRRGGRGFFMVAGFVCVCLAEFCLFWEEGFVWLVVHIYI